MLSSSVLHINKKKRKEYKTKSIYSTPVFLISQHESKIQFSISGGLFFLLILVINIKKNNRYDYIKILRDMQDEPLFAYASLLVILTLCALCRYHPQYLSLVFCALPPHSLAYLSLVWSKEQGIQHNGKEPQIHKKNENCMKPYMMVYIAEAFWHKPQVRSFSPDKKIKAHV